MKKIDLGQTITILANIGVIGGILLLAYELRQNNIYLQEEARSSYFQNRLDATLLRGTDSDVARLWYWQSTDEPLSELDRRRRDDLMMANFLSWQHDYQSVQRGTLDVADLSIAGIRGNWQNTPGIEETWKRRKVAFSPDFISWLEENVISN
jgi:hypothetical protein